MITLQDTTRRRVMAFAVRGLTMLLALGPPAGLAADKAASPPYPAVDVTLAVHRVPDSNSYYVLGQPAVPSKANEGFTSNAGFVVTEAGVVVYDALGTPSLGYALIQAIRKVTDKPIKYVVAGHYHADTSTACRHSTITPTPSSLPSAACTITLAATRQAKDWPSAVSPWRRG